jgi:hypothetical protein
MTRPILYYRNILRFAVMAILISGCSGGGSSIRYYVIDPVTYPGGGAPGSSLTVEIMDVHIPQYLERFNLVVRGDQNQIQFAELHQWGDNFRKNLLRALAQNLSSLLATDDIGTPVNRTLSPPDYRVQIHIEQFERDYDGHVRLVARWQVLTVNGETPVTTHRAELSSPGSYVMNDYVNIVPAMQDLYGELSRMIADTITNTGTSG